MTVPRLLLVCDVPLDGRQIGGIYLGELCAMYPKDRLAVCVVGEGGSRWIPALDGVRRAEVRKPPEHGLRGFTRHGARYTRRPYEQYVRRLRAPRAVSEVIEFGRAWKPGVVWVPLAGPTLIAAAAKIAAALGAELVTTVWDPPEYYLPTFHELRGATLAPYLEHFAEDVRRSRRCATGSEGMKRAYEQRFAVPCVVLRYGVPRRLWQSPRVLSPERRELVVGYAGSLYARAEWSALVAALDGVGWRVAGRDVVVRMFGWRLDLHANGPMRIDYRGWHSVASTVAELSHADVCYLPYWFDDFHRDAVRLSFPGKASTYVAAGVPVLYHGPRDSSPAEFLARYPAGLGCHSLDASELLAALERCACDPTFRLRAADAGRRALEEELGLHVSRRRFAELVGADESELAAEGETAV